MGLICCSVYSCTFYRGGFRRIRRHKFLNRQAFFFVRGHLRMDRRNGDHYIGNFDDAYYYAMVRIVEVSQLLRRSFPSPSSRAARTSPCRPLAPNTHTKGFSFVSNHRRRGQTARTNKGQFRMQRHTGHRSAAHLQVQV